MKTHARSWLCIFLLSVLILSGCNLPTAAEVPPTAAPQSPTSAAVVDTPAPEPTPTAGTAHVLFVAPEGAPQAQAVSAALKDLAGKSGLPVEQQAELTADVLTPEVKVVVLLTAPDNLVELAKGAPGTQFVALSSAVLPDKVPNLSVIVDQPEQEAFLGGYIAELLTNRVSPVGLLPSGTPNADALQSAYLAGARHFCGACRLVPNFEQVGPLAVAQPAGTDAGTWQAAISPVAKNGLDVVYVSAEVATPELLNLLVSQQARLVGNFDPPAEAQSQWVATVHADPVESLKILWPDLMAGKGGKQVAARVMISNVQPTWLTPGRQRLAVETRDQLEQGLVGALPVPGQ